ncbi:MAG: hypothetical protein ABID63_11885, partial [Pseudomonadota bacterium]
IRVCGCGAGEADGGTGAISVPLMEPHQNPTGVVRLVGIGLARLAIWQPSQPLFGGFPGRVDVVRQFYRLFSWIMIDC